MAVNCWDKPRKIVGFVGVTAIETNAEAVTVKVVEPVTERNVAPIVVLPCVTLVANPAEPMVATPVADELQVTVLVRS